MNVLLTIVASVFVFGLVIFVHELGHFFVAKKAGIKVNEFAMGMGPTLFKITKGETTYALRLFPIGGFVQMEGEDEESEDARSFPRASIPKRMAVLVAGAAMNLLLGFLVLVVLTASGGLIASTTVAEFAPDASTQATGLAVGDRIIAVNGRRCFVANDVIYEFARTQNYSMDLLVVRNGEQVLLEGVTFAAGEYIDDTTGEPMQWLVIDFTVYGIKPTVGAVLKESLNATISNARLIYLMIFDLIAGRAAVNDLSGPVGIVSSISQAVSLGWRPVMQMLVLITINLGVVNMLPIPAMDGGKLLLLIVEAIRRKPLNQKLEIAVNLTGFALLMLLMVFVSFNDIRRLFF